MIPYSILQNKELKDTDKITLSLIYSFYNNNKEMYMSNNKLGTMLGISRTAASERITKLETLGYIQCNRIMINGKEKRTITPLRMVGEPTNTGRCTEPTSRSTDSSLVGEVGSIIYPLLDKELDKELYNTGLSKIELKTRIIFSLNINSEQLNKFIEEGFSNYWNPALLEQNKDIINEYIKLVKL